MNNVLLGAFRSKGEIKETKKKYDNIKLFLGDYRDFKKHGITYQGALSPVKIGDRSVDVRKVDYVSIRTVDFEEVAGVSAKDFLKHFEKEFMFHVVRVIFEVNAFGRKEVIELKISEKTCFVLHREFEAKKKLEVEDFDEDEDEDSDDEFEDLEDEPEEDDLDESEEDFDFDFNEETGEVSVKKVKKGVKSEKT